MTIKITFGDVRDGRLFSCIQKLSSVITVFSERLPLAEFLGLLDAAYQKKIEVYHQVRTAYGAPNRQAKGDWLPESDRIPAFESELSDLFRLELLSLEARIKISLVMSKVNSSDIDVWELAILARYFDLVVVPDDERQKLRDRVLALEAEAAKNLEAKKRDPDASIP